MLVMQNQFDGSIARGHAMYTWCESPQSKLSRTNITKDDNDAIKSQNIATRYEYLNGCVAENVSQVFSSESEPQPDWIYGKENTKLVHTAWQVDGRKTNHEIGCRTKASN